MKNKSGPPGVIGALARTNHRFRWLSDDEVMEAAAIVDEVNEFESMTSRCVNYCYELIAANRLVPGKTIKELAIIWGVSVETVKRHTAEAYRRFKAEIKDPEEIRAAIIQRLDTVMTLAMSYKKPYITREGEIVYADDPNFTAAIGAAREIKSLAGLDSKKITHTVDYENADLQELVAEWQKHKEKKQNEPERISGYGSAGLGAPGSILRKPNSRQKVLVPLQTEGAGDPPVCDPDTEVRPGGERGGSDLRGERGDCDTDESEVW